MTFLREKIAQYDKDLQQQRYAYPFMSITADECDSRLREFVRLHHLDLTRLTNYQVNRFKDQLQEKRLSQQLHSFHFTTQQVRYCVEEIFCAISVL